MSSGGSKIGRKSAKGQEAGALWRFSQNHSLGLLPKRITGTVVSVVGAEGTVEQARNINEASGITFVINIPSMKTAMRVRCGHPYDVLRTCFGTDDNLIGRICTITYIGTGPQAISAGVATFDVYPGVKYCNENKAGGSIISIGSFNGCGVDTSNENEDDLDRNFPGEKPGISGI